jgi:predicted  nucleic acid-binding Zn-ribbon protein
MLEERINMANRKIEVGESNMLENQKRNNVDIRQLNSEIIDVKRLIEEIKEKMDVILRELPNLAARDELEVLKRYIEMWEPMKFVTRNEIDKILEEKKE